MEKKNLRVIILIGLPGSGKTTWAKEFCARNENFVRVNRDDFRFMLCNSPTVETKIEFLISELMAVTITKALKMKQNIVVDNTNLKIKYINALLDLVTFQADVEYMLFDVSAKKCIERDANRDKKVGESVILNMEKDLKRLKDSFVFQNIVKKHEYTRPRIVPNLDSKLPHAVLFDIDGTLAHMGRRTPFDWDKVGVDDLNWIVAEQAKFHKSLGRTVIVISGRDSSCKVATEEWLQFYGVPYDLIYMRPEGDMRKDTVIKKEIYKKEILDKYNVLCVYDDRLSVVQAWHELELFVFTVNQGLFEW